MIIPILIIIIVLLTATLIYLLVTRKPQCPQCPQYPAYQPCQPCPRCQPCDVGDRVRFIDIQKTACYGSCPEYSAIIYTDGLVNFHGVNNVAFIGDKQFQLTHSQMALVTQELQRLNFFCLKDEYDGPVTDLPATIVTVYKNGGNGNNSNNYKTVKARYGTPHKLTMFNNRLHELLMMNLN